MVRCEYGRAHLTSDTKFQYEISEKGIFQLIILAVCNNVIDIFWGLTYFDRIGMGPLGLQISTSLYFCSNAILAFTWFSFLYRLLNREKPKKWILTLAAIPMTAAVKRAQRMEELYRRQKFLISPIEKRLYGQFEEYIKKPADSLGGYIQGEITAKKKRGIPGLSYSTKRALGVSKAKSCISRKTGIPTTKSGVQRKVGKAAMGGGCVLYVLGALALAAAFAVL